MDAFHQFQLVCQMWSLTEREVLATVTHVLIASRVDYCKELYMRLPLKTVLNRLSQGCCDVCMLQGPHLSSFKRLSVTNSVLLATAKSADSYLQRYVPTPHILVTGLQRSVVMNVDCKDSPHFQINYDCGHTH